MNKMQHIRGVLYGNDPKGIKDSTPHSISEAIITSRLGSVIQPGNWGVGILEINSFTASTGGRHAAMEFLKRLRKFLQHKGVAALRLKGELMVTEDTNNDPVIIRVIVEGKKVTYQQAALTWGEPRSN